MKVVAKPIEMVAWFTTDGHPNPVKFRFQNDDSTFDVIRVDRILCTDVEKLAGNMMIVFRCQSSIDSMDRIYEIKYELRTCKWILFKI
jgi:hypothetical protein